MSDYVTDDARAEMRRVLEDQFWPFLAHDPHDPERFWGLAVDVVMRAAARAETTTATDEDALRGQVDQAVGGVLWNATNHPDPVAVLGKDIGPMRAKVVDAVMDALATAHTRMERALRAVAAMHRPELQEPKASWIAFCRECGLEWGDDGCPTAVTIEEALGNE